MFGLRKITAIAGALAIASITFHLFLMVSVVP